MQKAYNYSILYFLLFSLLLLTSSTLLFGEKIGFSPASILDYYLGNEDKFMIAKTTTGLLKIVLPHIFAFGLFLMVVLHFVMFTKVGRKRSFHFTIYLLFTVAFIELFTPFLILNGFEIFAFIKLISFFIFEVLLIYFFWVLFRSILWE